MKKHVTHERLLELMHYDPVTGVFTRKKQMGRFPPGQKVGTLNKAGYLYCRIDCIDYGMHRLAWFYVTNVWPTQDIDHINGQSSDNRIENLRHVTRQTNMENQVRANCKSKSGVLGVSKCSDRNRWVAQIKVNGKGINLGRFRSLHDAEQAYKEAKEKLHAGFVKERLKNLPALESQA